MRIVATADFHGRALPDIPECDLFIYAGDIGGREFAFEEFGEWLDDVPATHKIGVAGNHDFWAEPRTGHDSITAKDSAARQLPWTYLYNEAVDIDGLVVWGSPFCNRFHDWAFMGDEDLLAQVWATMPDNTDLVVTHGPPYGVCDRVAHPGDRDPHVGSTSLRERLVAVPSVRWAVCGHIHEAYGSGKIVRPDDTEIQVFNVSIVDERYQVRNPPVDWEITLAEA